MAQSLYRKWRPKNFSDIVGQDHITTTLQNSLKNDLSSHAYIFAGPRGSGKTSMARILAKAVNCTNPKDGNPCETCEICVSFSDLSALDLVEIDAASNRGIDDVRELKEGIRFTPATAKYKVYIIDEAHMLTKEAFNALLKTLEEPPAHAIFILATTEAHRLPDTILSRCQRFDFTVVSDRDLRERLQQIAAAEKIVVEEGAMEMIIKQSGSFRDAISLLDQLGSGGQKVSAEFTAEMLKIVDFSTIVGINTAALSGEGAQALGLVKQTLSDGADSGQLYLGILTHARDLLLAKIDPGLATLDAESTELLERVAPEQLIRYLDALQRYATVRTEAVPSLGLELAIVRSSLGTVTAPKAPIAQAERPVSTATVPVPAAKAEPPRKAEVPSRPAPKTVAVEEAAQEDLAIHAGPQPAPVQKTPVTLDLVLDSWGKILNGTKAYNHSIAAFLLVARPSEVVGTRLVVAFPYKFHRERIAELKNRQIVEKVIEDILGSRLELDCILGDQNLVVEAQALNAAAPSLPVESADLIDTALEIFGGRVVS